jgi:hypothetical protein
MTVAVKTVLFSEREDGDSKLPHERAIMEAAVCTSVAHRNVVSTYHYGGWLACLPMRPPQVSTACCCFLKVLPAE